MSRGERPGLPADARADGRGSGPGGGRRVRVKICGVGRERDVEAAAAAGADYVGLVLAESPRRVAEDGARELAARAAGAGMRPVGVFVDRPVEQVRALADRLGLRVVQLHGDETPGACRTLRGPDLRVWKAVRPRSAGELREAAARYADAVDALLVEGYSPEAAGGTGTGFPREWLWGPDGERVADRLVLAGGLEPGNVAEAVRDVRPEVVDVSSGVEEAPGRKDPDRVRAFVEAARGALAGGDAGERRAGPSARGPRP